MLEGGTHGLSRNVGQKIPKYAAQNHRTAYISDLETFSISSSSIEINLV